LPSTSIGIGGQVNSPKLIRAPPDTSRLASLSNTSASARRVMRRRIDFRDGPSPTAAMYHSSDADPCEWRVRLCPGSGSSNLKSSHQQSRWPAQGWWYLGFDSPAQPRSSLIRLLATSMTVCPHLSRWTSAPCVKIMTLERPPALLCLPPRRGTPMGCGHPMPSWWNLRKIAACRTFSQSDQCQRIGPRPPTGLTNANCSG